MLDSTGTPSGSKEKSKILFTGSGQRAINDLIRLYSIQFIMESCLPTESSFRDALKSLRPHVVVACLADEPRETYRMLSYLKDMPQYRNIPLIAIGNEDDCLMFQKHVFQKQTEIFIRPLDTNRFIQILNKLIDESKQESQSNENNVKSEDNSVNISEIHRAEVKKQLEEAEAEKILKEKIEKLSNIKGRKTILVADDDVRMLNVIKLYLQDLYDVVVVPSGKLAIKYLSKKKADLVLLDYMMPDEDGPEVLRQIRKNSPCPNIPVLFLTGVSDKDLVMRGLELLPRGYLLKPVTREILLEKVTEILLGLQ